MLLTATTSPGTGLFVQRPPSRSVKLPPMDHAKTKGLGEVDREVPDVKMWPDREPDLAPMLEAQVEALLTKTEQLKADNLRYDIEIRHLENEMKRMEADKKLTDEQVLREREVKRVFEKEVERLKERLRTEGILNGNLKRANEDLQKEVLQVREEYGKVKGSQENGVRVIRDIGKESKEEVRRLEEEVMRARNEVDEIQGRLQAREEIAMRVEEEMRKQINDLRKESQMESEKKTNKITNLVGQLADVSEKLAESEHLRKNYIEKNKYLEKVAKDATETLAIVQEDLSRAKKEAKTLRNARSSNTKILDKKIESLTQAITSKDSQIKDLISEISTYKQLLKSPEQISVCPVEVVAKPSLFGCDSDSDYD